MSTVAVFFAVGGGTAVALNGSNTVFSDDITDAQVKNSDLAADSIGPRKVVDGSLGPNEIVPDSLTAGRLAPNSVAASELADRLSGSANSALLGVDNNNADTNATALDLQVEPGLTPFKVNSSTQVNNLNADLVDGRSASSFVANSTYRLGQGQERAGDALGDGSKVLSQSCLAGDRLLSGGPASVNVNSDVLDDFARDTVTWQARINDSAVSGGDSFTVVVLCADQ
jgi:hypothetical protein